MNVRFILSAFVAVFLVAPLIAYYIVQFSYYMRWLP